MVGKAEGGKLKVKLRFTKWYRSKALDELSTMVVSSRNYSTSEAATVLSTPKMMLRFTQKRLILLTPTAQQSLESRNEAQY